MVESYQQVFESMLFETFGKEMEVLEFTVLSAGMVNTGSRLVTEDEVLFVKMNEQPIENFFKQEAENLQLLKSLGLSTPQVYGYGKVLGYNYLICELISEGQEEKQLWQQAGRLIGFLHTHKNEKFGFDSDNYLVDMKQDNRWQEDGIAFLVQNRILPAVGQCLMEEKISLSLYKSIESICHRLDRIIPQESPSLLHGDLWTGNVILSQHRKPYFIDPACYYGLRENELAFSYLFGGFDASFYDAYLEVCPIQTGFGERVSVYHIHPLLIHIYYFGSGYIPGLERIIKRFS